MKPPPKSITVHVEGLDGAVVGRFWLLEECQLLENLERAYAGEKPDDLMVSLLLDCTTETVE
jgi:hypothetical protein